ncbi:hypothetical protein [Actinophytocola oryzae]|uniref:IclR-like helix-turn-helix domain-containing protein n=1 Tax=Actinophytocola oryzae TaxID=502181 RepID=A0A4R7VJY7_9PSEU|nr:hypothetical protein [Actinophytocola oryzae]TDV49764.1 hypothetical protein CLV71_107103 [Actinophytocola oryzae]
MSVRHSISLSYANLPEAARTLFRLLGWLSSRRFSTRTVATLAGTTPAATGGLLEKLAGAGLLQRRPGGLYELHSLFQEFAVEADDED